MANPSPPLKAQNGVLPSSEDSLFVKQPQGNPRVDEAQLGQTIANESRGPANGFPHPLATDQQRPDAALLKEPLTSGRFTGNLLSRPAFKPVELNQGFEYGPPVPIDPDQFSRRICSPATPRSEDQPSRPRVGFPVPTNTVTKPMFPKPQLAEPRLDGNAANKHLTLLPPRSHHGLDPSIVHRVSNDTHIGRLPLNKKASPTRAVEPSFPHPPRTEAQGRVHNTNEPTEPRAVPFEQQPDFPVDHHNMPPPCRDLGEKGRNKAKGGQEQASTHHAQPFHGSGSEGTGSERSRNLETVGRRTSPGETDFQRTTSEPHHDQHQDSGTTTETLDEFSPRIAHARAPAHGGSNHTTPMSEGDPAFLNSNVSKRRSTRPVSHQPPPSAYSTSDARSESFASSPLNLAVKNTHELSNSMAKAINHFNISQKTEMERQKSHYKHKLRAFERKVAEKCDTIDKQRIDITNQGKENQSLRDSMGARADKMRSLEAMVEELEAQNQSLVKENQASQDQLARSADVSQNLMDQLERRNGELTKEVQALKTSLKQSHDSLTTKEKREKELDERIMRYKQETEDVCQQNSVLKQQLGDANHHLDLEKTISQTLLEKLEESKATSKNFESLFAQHEEVVRRLDEQKTQIDTQCHRGTEESNSKLDAITERMESLTNALSAQPDTLSNMENFQRESLTQINSKLEGILESQTNARESAGHLSTEIEESIGKIQKQIDHREGILAQQIEEKTRENSTLASLLREKEARSQDLEAALEKQKGHSRKLEVQKHDLRGALGLMEAEAKERERQQKAFEDESKWVEEELASREATIKDLENKLEQQSNAFEEKMEQHSADILKLSRVLQEKDEASRILISQSVDVARQEVLLDKEREVEKVKELLHQTQQHRDALSDQIGKLIEDSARGEQTRRQDAITISSLRESLSAAENRCEQATNEKLAQASQLEQVKARESTTLEALRTQIVALDAQMVKSEQVANTQIAKGTEFVSMLKQLAEQHGVVSVGEELEKLFEGTITVVDMASTIAQVVDQLIGPHQSSTTTTMVDRADSEPTNRHNEALTETSEVNHSDTNDGTQGSGMEVDLLLSESRRVVVRSPAGFQLEPSPAPSVFQEKERRRQGLQPKSIMKRVTRSMGEPDWPTDSQEHVSMSQITMHRESSDPLGNTTANEITATHHTVTRSRKRSSGESASSALTGARRKRTKGVDQKHTAEVVFSPSAPEEDISNERLTENKAQVKDSGNKSAPRQVSGGGKISASQSTPVVLGQGRDVANQSSFRRQSRQRTYGSQKSSQSPQPTQSESQVESQPDALSGYWPPQIDTQETIDPLDDDDDKGQADYLRQCLI